MTSQLQSAVPWTEAKEQVERRRPEYAKASSKVAGFLQGKSLARSGLLITSMQECEHLIGLMSLSSVTKGRFTRRWWPTLVATLPPTSPHPAQAALFP